MFEEFLGGAAELKVPATVDLPAARSVDLSVKAATASVERAAAAHERVRRASWTAGSVTGEKRLLPQLPVTAADDDPTAVVSADTPSRRADAGAAWGTLVHGLLEHAMRHKGGTQDDLRRLAMWLTVDEPGLRPVIDEAIATVQSMTTREFWGQAKASPECHEEVPFAIAAAVEKDAVPKVLHGTIDAVFRDGASWRVVDYKTDADGAAVSLTDRYQQQLEAYAAAWRRFVEGDVTTAVVDARRKNG
jgi:ATP-dependent exoDNAse (exonuclease V) beta subunit